MRYIKNIRNFPFSGMVKPPIVTRIINDSIIPVSYTHLDVYKRQQWMVPRMGSSKIINVRKLVSYLQEAAWEISFSPVKTWMCMVH